MSTGIYTEVDLGGEINRVADGLGRTELAMKNINTAALLMVADAELDPRLMTDEVRARFEATMNLYMTIMERAEQGITALAGAMGIQIEPVQELPSAPAFKELPPAPEDTTANQNGSIHAEAEPAPEPVAAAEQVEAQPVTEPTGVVESRKDPSPSKTDNKTQNEVDKDFDYWGSLVAPKEHPEKLPDNPAFLKIDSENQTVHLGEKSLKIVGKNKTIVMNGFIIKAGGGFFARGDLEAMSKGAPLPQPFSAYLKSLAEDFEKKLGIKLYEENGSKGAGMKYRTNPRIVPIALEESPPDPKA